MIPAPGWLLEWAQARGGATTPKAEKSSILPPAPPHIRARARLGLVEIDQQQDRNNELEGFIKALAIIPANIGYDDWFEIGAAIHDFDPSETGLLIFKSWAWQSERHRTEADQLACEKKWREYQKPKSDKRLITKASVYGRASDIARQQAVPQANIVPNTAPGAISVSPANNGVPATLPAQLAQGSQIRFPDLDKAGNPRSTCANTRVAIQKLGLCCQYDTFHGKFNIGGQQVGQWAGDITDDMVHVLRIVTLGRFSFDPGSQHAYDAAVQECRQHAYHPVLAYLEGLEWDREPRIGRWLPTYMQADDSVLTREMGKLMLLAAVRRIRSPGAKFDQILVLEGPEGKGKSLALETLAGRENFSDHAILTLDDRHQQEEVRGVWLYEISEMSGIRKADIDRVKAFASRTVDRARPAYGRKRIDQPRTCVFFGTTNEQHYLQSMTGNRRFWPVTTNRIDIEGIARDRDQLWAEAAYHEKAGASIGLRESFWSEAVALQEGRRERDPWEDRINEVTIPPRNSHQTAYGTEWRLTSTELLSGPVWLGIPTGNITIGHYKRLTQVMHKLGWEGPTDIKLEGNKVAKGYKKLGSG